MKIMGQIMLWIGFLSGSLATVFHAPSDGVEYVTKLTPEAVEGFDLPDLSAVEIPNEGWNLIPWTWYLASIGVCVAGIVFLRVGKASEGQKSEKTGANLAEIKTSLDRLIENTIHLSKETDQLAPSQIARKIDETLADDLRIFADGRDSITSEFGLNVFADVMTQFAAGERSINRAWSAAADGYVDESATCVDRAIEMFREAKVLLDSAELDSAE
jgi:hypothetical protein